MITVLGLGFVGLTTALGFCEMGNKVYGIEINKERLNDIKLGKLPFLEPGLDDALVRHLNKNFIPTTNLEQAIKESEYIYYCVGTPYGENGQADLTYLYKAIDETLRCIKDNKFRVLVVKSTIPPSTTSTKIIPYVESKGYTVGEQLGVTNNPEFLREGHCWDDFIDADRVVLGVSDDKSKEMLCNLYRDVKVPVHSVSLNTGEFIKYLSNTLLATLISYSNEMSIIADHVGGIDVKEAFKILVEDKRWGDCNMTSYVYPGCGYGGYCLPKDTNALYSLTKSIGYEPEILKNVIKVNDNMPKVIVNRILSSTDINKKIGILGLAFKPLSNDVRETAAGKVIKELISVGCFNIIAYDPVANDEFKKHYKDITIGYCNSRHELIEKADVLVILTAWDEFKEINKETDKPIIDARFML